MIDCVTPNTATPPNPVAVFFLPKTKMQKVKKYLLYTSLALLIGITLLQSKMFLSSFAFSYYGYHIVGAVWVLGAAVLCIRQKSIAIPNVLPLLFYLLFVGYGIINSCGINHTAFNFGHIGLSVHCLVFLAYLLFFTTKKLNFALVARLLVLFSIIESWLCVFQYFDWVATRGKMFEVYGSLPNPNYTAMFFAMALPALLYSLYEEKTFFCYVAMFALPSVFVALLLLQCRTAIVGAALCLAYSFSVRYAILSKISVFLQTIKKVQLAFYSLVFVTFASFLLYFLYTFKQNSSEGRLMIWKIGTDLALQKPIFGHGVASFEKEYNLAQAAYFESGKANANEVFNAAHISVPYNDYLYTFIEGGAIGLLLFCAFIGSLLLLGFSRTAKTSEFQAAYSGVLTFAVMSFFNAQLYVTVTMSLLMLYAAVLCTFTTPFGKTIELNSKTTKILVFVLFLLGFYFLNNQYNMAKAARAIKVASVRTKKEKPEAAIFLLEKQKEIFPFSDQLWIVYGNALQTTKDYQGALEKYKKAEMLCSDPDLFIEMSHCYFPLQRYDEAMKSCSLAMNIAPNKIQARFELMNIFATKHDTLNALKLADEVLAQTPKGISKEAPFFKEEAKKMKNLLSQIKN